MKKKLGSFLLLCLVATLGISLTSCSGFSMGTHNVTSHETSTSETVEPPLGDNPEGDSSSSSESQKEDETPDIGSSTDTENPGQSGDTQNPNEDDKNDDDDDDDEEENDDDTPIVTYAISFASPSYEFEIDETLDLSGEVTCTASDQSVATYTLSVNNSSFTVDGYTISASEATSAIVTATCDQDTSVKASASITATPLPEPVTYTISFASASYEFEIDETLDLSGEVTCTASDQSVATYTLSVSNPSFIVDGYTISASEATNATVTATCDQDTSVKATASITATPLPEPEPDPEPEPGEETVTTYKIGAYNTSVSSYYYLTGNNSGNYAEATTSWDEAADFYIDEVSGGYTLSTIKNGTTYYVRYSGSNSYLTVDTTSYTWVYNSTYDTYATASNGRFIGNRTTYTDIRCYALSNLSSSSTEYFPAHAYVSSTESQETPSTGDEKTYTQTYTLNSSNSLPSDITSYTTGGFASETYNNYTFEMYRGVSLSNYFIKILAEVGNANTASTLPGMLLNTTGFYDIAKIELTYKTSANSYKQKTQDVPHIYYGNTSSYGYTYDLSTSSSDKTVTIDTSGSNIQFFCLSTTYYDVSISSLSVYYNSGSKASWTTSSCGTDQKRIEPVRYSGTLVANSSSVQVPVDVTYNSNGTCTVNSYKTLTYDTYDSAYAAKRTTNAYTDPVDVAAYFIAFGTYPCNYVETSNYSTAYSVFGNKTRFWSYYTRTNGYATAVPYRSAKYYELDIALTSNYTKSSTSYSRGVGRLVCWIDGFSGYSTYPVVTYTDDHYYTFKEYYNDGTFGLNFNAEGKVTPYVYGYPTTIS